MRRIALVLTLGLAATLLAAVPAHAGKQVTIRGGGWGHGIGMSQYGAYGRALNGRSSKEILEKYYTDAKVAEASMPASLRVGLLPDYGSSVSGIAFSPYARSDDDEGRVVLRVAGTKDPIVKGVEGDSFRLEATQTGGFRVFMNDSPVKQDGVSVFGTPDDPVLIKFAPYNTRLDVDGKPYDYVDGKMEAAVYQSTSCNGYCARLVLRIPMQKYLYGLGEVPSSWPVAALEAQAIAGRTYAFEKVTRLGQHRLTCDCAVYDSTIDQAYIGDAKRTGSGQYWDEWKGAVDATKDQVILYKGNPIQALYSSSSGGHTEHNENVWGGSPLAYLRGVSDRPDGVDANPNHRWEVTMSWSDFQTKLNSDFGVGKVEKFELVEPFGVSGRVTVVKSADKGGVRIVGSIKTERVSGWAVRGALGLKDTLWFRVESYWADATGALAVRGAFYDAYLAAGGPQGELGPPIDERQTRSTLPGGGRRQRFQEGTLYRVPEGAVFGLWGPIDGEYRELGEATSACGYPTTSITGDGGHLEAAFQHGSITWEKDGGVTVDC